MKGARVLSSRRSFVVFSDALMGAQLARLFDQI
jgi:hypothetical protein